MCLFDLVETRVGTEKGMYKMEENWARSMNSRPYIYIYIYVSVRINTVVRCQGSGQCPMATTDPCCIWCPSISKQTRAAADKRCPDRARERPLRYCPRRLEGRLRCLRLARLGHKPSRSGQICPGLLHALSAAGASLIMW